jgi:hypothetical protein
MAEHGAERLEDIDSRVEKLGIDFGDTESQT